MVERSDDLAELLPGDRGWKPGSFTELRVHGVGNTALERLLDDPNPRQVAGDEVAGFFRSRADRPLVVDPVTPTQASVDDCRDEVLRKPSTGPPGWQDKLTWTDVEAYDWGGFSTGGGWKAMWLFLIPFTLANVAGWLVAGRNRWAQKWVRVFGLGISLLFVTWLGAVVIDLVALRCGWQQACYGRQVWLVPYSWPIFSNPSSRMALALLVPLAVTFVLWYWPGRKIQQKYEQPAQMTTDALLEAVPTSSRPDPDDEERDNWLRNPRIWARDSEVRFDASLHGAAILATLGGCVAYANWAAKGQAYDLGLVMVGGLLLLSAVLVIFGWSPFSTDAGMPTARMVQTRWIGWISIFFIVLVIATSFIDRGYATVDWAEAEGLSPGFLTDLAAVESEADGLSNSIRDALFMANGVLLTVSIVVLGVIALGTRKVDAERNRRLWGKWGPVAALLAGLAIAASLVAGAGLWLEEWLGDRPTEHLEALGTSDETIEDLDSVQQRLDDLIEQTGEVNLPLLAYTAQQAAPREQQLAQPVIALPVVYDLAALGFLAMVVVMLVQFVILELRLRRSIRRDAFPSPDAMRSFATGKISARTLDEQRAWTKVGVREMRKSPRLTRLHHLFWPPALFVLAYGIFLFLDGLDRNLQWTESVVEWFTAQLPWSFTVARWMVTVTIVFVATLVYRSYKPESQESFGGMWDVISFLPRHYHPFAVPSYGVRAVPELSQRIDYLARAGGQEGGCLVSAHSGGVVISIAAIALLKEDVRKRVSFLSYGSPTGALYGRAYPEYFDTERLIEDVAMGLGDVDQPDEPKPNKIRWFNLWRLTDWTGGYSFGPSRDRFAEFRGTDSVAPPASTYAEYVNRIEHLQFDPGCRTLSECPEYDPVPTAIGHTDYLHDPKHHGAEDPRYQDARGALLRMMT
jgi:hypothetical protein